MPEETDTYFSGEEMTCIMSGRKQVSDPTLESGWTSIVLDGKRYDISPEWLDGGYRNWGHKDTWAKIFKKIESLHPTEIKWGQYSTEFREHRKGGK